MLQAGAGLDRLEGGGGEDIADYSDARGRVLAVLAGAGAGRVARAERWSDRDEIAPDVEGARGGPGADTLLGNARDNLLDGGAGADQIDGGGGPDRLRGGPGPDLVVARDGEADEIRCGPARDLAVVDADDEIVALRADLVRARRRRRDGAGGSPRAGPRPRRLRGPGALPGRGATVRPRGGDRGPVGDARAAGALWRRAAAAGAASRPRRPRSRRRVQPRARSSRGRTDPRPPGRQAGGRVCARLARRVAPAVTDRGADAAGGRALGRRTRRARGVDAGRPLRRHPRRGAARRGRVFAGRRATLGAVAGAERTPRPPEDAVRAWNRAASLLATALIAAALPATASAAIAGAGDRRADVRGGARRGQRRLDRPERQRPRRHGPGRDHQGGGRLPRGRPAGPARRALRRRGHPAARHRSRRRGRSGDLDGRRCPPR